MGGSRTRTAALLIAAASVLPLAACGHSSSNGTTATTGNGRNSAFTAYVDCLRKNGVTITLPSRGARTRPSGRPFPSGQPRPRPSGSGFPGGGFPGGGRFPGGGGFLQKPSGVDDATWQKAQTACASLRPSGNPNRPAADQAYLNCLRDHGVTPGPDMNRTDPNVVKAMAVCKVLRPSAAPSPTPSA